MILTIKVIVIKAIIITIIIKCRGRYRTTTATNNELLVTLQNGRRPSKNISPRCCHVSLNASETAYSSLNVMNRGRPYRLNSLLGTLLHLISQE